MAFEDLRLMVGSDVLDLSGKITDPATGCRVYATSDTTFGQPEPLTEVLTNLLRNGDQVIGLGYGNRLPSVGLAIEGPDLDAVARMEERIQRDFVGRPALLRWQPDDPAARPCVFEVSFSSLPHQFDRREGSKKLRLFNWNLTALPFARAEHPTRVRLSTGGTPPTVLNDCTSTTGWLTSAGSVALTAGPAVRVSPVPERFWVRLVQQFTLHEGDQLAIEFYGMVPPWVYAVGVDGSVILLSQQSQVRVSEEHRYRAIYGAAWRDSEIAYIQMGKHPFESQYDWWWRAFSSLDLVEFWGIEFDSDPTTGRQALLDFTAGGSAPTYGSMHIGGDAALGDVLIHTGPNNGAATPPWSGYVGETAIINAPRYTDATSPSGLAWDLFYVGSGRRFGAEFPASQFAADGAGVNWLIARCSTATTEKLLWSVRSRAGGEDVGRVVRGETFHTFSAPDKWELIPLGATPLPPTRTGQGGAVQVRVEQPNDATGVVTVGDGYLLRTGPDHSTTVLRAGNHTDVWIDAPSIDDPAGSIWVGTGDRAHAFKAGSLVAAGAHKPHTFLPDGTRVWLLTGTTGVDFEVTYYARWQDHATESGGIVAWRT